MPVRAGRTGAGFSFMLQLLSPRGFADVSPVGGKDFLYSESKRLLPPRLLVAKSRIAGGLRASPPRGSSPEWRRGRKG